MMTRRVFGTVLVGLKLLTAGAMLRQVERGLARVEFGVSALRGRLGG